MLESYFQGFLLGLGAAVPLGPINILIINYALKKYKYGILIGFGAMSADIFYLSLIFIGVVSFLNNPVLLNSFGILGSFFLLYIGFLIYKNRYKKIEENDKVVSKSSLKLYMQGFILTLLNPYTIAFWASVTGYTVHQELDILYTLVGMMSALLLWIVGMPYFISRAKHKISEKMFFYINMFSSIILVGFGLSLLFNLVIYS